MPYIPPTINVIVTGSAGSTVLTTDLTPKFSVTPVRTNLTASQTELLTLTPLGVATLGFLGTQRTTLAGAVPSDLTIVVNTSPDYVSVTPIDSGSVFLVQPRLISASLTVPLSVTPPIIQVNPFMTNAVTSSYAYRATLAEHSVSSSLAYMARYAEGYGGLQESASYAVYADSAGAVEYLKILNLPTLVSSSLQFDSSSMPFTGSFTGSFRGRLDGQAATAVFAGNSTYAQYSVEAETASIALLANSVPYVSVSGKPLLVSSSAQVSTGSFYGDFTGNFIGTSSYIETSSYAKTASLATSISFIPSSASYAITASFASRAPYSTLIEIPSGIISSSTQLPDGIISSSTQLPGGIISSSTQLPSGTVSSSAQISTGSFTGSFVGTLIGTASFATTSSAATSLTFIPLTSSYSHTASYVVTAITSSAATSLTFVPLTSSYAATASYRNLTDIPSGMVSSSAQINTGSFTGSFVGTLQGSASFATTSSAATSITFVPITASYAVTSSFAASARSASAATSITFVPVTASYSVTSSFAAAARSASAATSITFTPATSSYSITSSLASSVAYANVTGKPTLISASAQINTGSFTGSFVGTLTGTASFATTATTSSAATSITFVPATASFALTSSYAEFAGTVEFESVLNKPTLVSSSDQINTGSFTGSFVGEVVGTATTASFATTASAATTITFTPETASYAVTASWAKIAERAVSSSYADSAGATGGGLTGDGTQNYIAKYQSTTVLQVTKLLETDNLYVSESIKVSGSIEALSWPITASAFKGDGNQITGVISSSYAETSSYVPTVDFSGITNLPTLVSSSEQINTGSFTGSFIGDVQGVAQTASYAVTASAADSITFTPSTASYTEGVLYSNIIGKPTLISSSVQINTGSFTGSFRGTLTGTASFSTTASYSSVTPYSGITGKPTLISSSAQINTGSFTGSFIGTLTGTASFATTASAATSITFVPLTSSYSLTASVALNAGPATSASWASSSITSSYAETVPSTGVLGVVDSASYAYTASVALNVEPTVSSSWASSSLTASYVDSALTASYVSGGIIIIGLPSDGTYGGSAGNVSGIASGDEVEDAFDKVEVILGKLAPAKPANLSTRTLTIQNIYTALEAVTGTSRNTIINSYRPSGSWTFVAANSGSGTSASYDGDAGTLSAEINGNVSIGSQRIMTSASDVGRYENLVINQDIDPYDGTFGQQGFWKGFIATVGPTSSLSLGANTYRLLHSTTGNTPLYTFYVDNPSTPTVTAITGSASFAGAVRYVSGVPSMATGDSVFLRVTASNAVSQFYNSTRIFRGSSGVAQGNVDVTPSPSPASASLVSSSITLLIANNQYAVTSSYTATAYNSIAATSASTWTPTTIRVDTVSNESVRRRSGIGWFPNIDSSISGAGAPWTSSFNLSGSKELQMTNGIFHYPSASNYAALYPLGGPDYRTLTPDTSQSIEFVRWVTFSASVVSVQNLQIDFSGTNAAFSGTITSGSMRLFVRVSGSAPSNGWIDGAWDYPGVGNPNNNGDKALVVGSSTATRKVVTFGDGTNAKTGIAFIRIGIPSSSLPGSTRVFTGITVTQV